LHYLPDLHKLGSIPWLSQVPARVHGSPHHDVIEAACSR
jgi:hypothetical protein